MTFESNTIENVQPCELEKALELIELDYTPHPCKYNGIQENSNLLFSMGISLSVLSFFFFCITFVSYCKTSKKVTVTGVVQGTSTGVVQGTSTAEGQGNSAGDGQGDQEIQKENTKSTGNNFLQILFYGVSIFWVGVKCEMPRYLFVLLLSKYVFVFLQLLCGIFVLIFVALFLVYILVVHSNEKHTNIVSIPIFYLILFDYAFSLSSATIL